MNRHRFRRLLLGEITARQYVNELRAEARWTRECLFTDISADLPSHTRSATPSGSSSTGPALAEHQRLAQHALEYHRFHEDPDTSDALRDAELHRDIAWMRHSVNGTTGTNPRIHRKP